MDLEETSGHAFLKTMLGCGSMRKDLVVWSLKILHLHTRCCLLTFLVLFETVHFPHLHLCEPNYKFISTDLLLQNCLILPMLTVRHS